MQAGSLVGGIFLEQVLQKRAGCRPAGKPQEQKALEMRRLRAFRDSLVDPIESDIKLYELMSEYPNRGTLRLKLQSELGDLIGKRREMALELEDLLDKMEDAEKRN